MDSSGDWRELASGAVLHIATRRAVTPVVDFRVGCKLWTNFDLQTAHQDDREQVSSKSLFPMVGWIPGHVEQCR